MKVLIVSNNAYYKGNGLCTAIHSLYDNLKESGVEVRIMACANPDPEGPQPEYPLKHFKFPVFEWLIYSNGFRFATIDRKLMHEAIEWADVLHLEEAFPLEAVAVRMARKMGKPCIGSYHLFAENILANLGVKRDRIFCKLINLYWKKSVFDHCAIVHCPTIKVRDCLLRYGYRAELRVISNGIDMQSPCQEEVEVQKTPYVVLCIGRYSNEKSQSTLLEAMRYSRHCHEIQLHFAGKGPKEKTYRREAKALVRDGVLSHEPIFGFYDKAELAKLCRSAYLYIHCARVEVEGLSCVEALREGAVPVIAEGSVTATSQFALDNRSTFAGGNPWALAKRIDWWIEHPEEREEAGKQYAASVSKYDVRQSTAAIIQMYEDAIKA